MTNEERREVARRLRKTRVERYNSILNGIHLGESVGVCAQIVSPHEDQVRAAADRLADLIEPGEDTTVSAYDLLSKEERRALNRWPRFDDGAPVWFGDEFIDHQGIVRSVLRIDMWQEGGFSLHTGQGTKDWHSAGEPAKRTAVPAADGEPLEVGQTVWDENGAEYVVCEVGPQSVTVEYWNEGIAAHGSIAPSKLTHIKPEPPDTWERIEADCSKADVEYCDKYGLLDPSCNADEGEAAERHCIDCGCTCGEKMARDLVRRCKALAERGE